MLTALSSTPTNPYQPASECDVGVAVRPRWLVLFIILNLVLVAIPVFTAAFAWLSVSIFQQSALCVGPVATFMLVQRETGLQLSGLFRARRACILFLPLTHRFTLPTHKRAYWKRSLKKTTQETCFTRQNTV